MGKLTAKQLAGMPDKLKEDRGTWEDHWRELAFYFQPLRREINEVPAKGNKRNQNLLDNTGIQGVELLSAGLQSMLTNPNLLWFELTTGDDELDDRDQVRQWLQKTTLIIHEVLTGSNFNTEVHQLYLDECTFGTAAMCIMEDDEQLIRFSTKHIKDIFIEENHLGYVDRLFREFEWDAANIVAEFGEAACSDKVLKAFGDGSTEKFKIVHGVYPKDYVENGRDELFPFISQFVLKDEAHFLREGGFREFPYVVPRWTKTANEVYGRSPAMNALPDMKTLNEMTKTMLVAAQKMADPPLQMPDDGFIMPIITRPGGLNYKRPGSDDIRPLFPNIAVDFGFQAIEDRRQRIRQSFFVDQLQLQNGPQMTATEVIQRTDEKNRLLGPVLGRMQSEFLQPLIDRIYDVCDRRGLITEAPAMVPDKIRVRYSSMIAKAQRISETQNILRTMETVSPFIQLDPAVADLFDGDEVGRVVARALGFPQRAMRSEKEIKTIRDSRAQAQQAMLKQQQEAQQADNMSKMASVSGNNGQGGAV